MRILAIETSCDETGLAVIDASKNKVRFLANLVSSQIQTHRPFGGVVPHLAKREHEQALPFLWKRLQRKSYGLKPLTLDLIAVTKGPGLAPCLWAGVNFAKDIAQKLKKPLVGINHLKGHIFINWARFKNIRWPLLSLIVSGGHTELVFSKKLGYYQIVGETRDDAAGEAFDKVAKLLDLGYPGGPVISVLAQKGDSGRFNLPRPMINSKNLDFSFAGLKTAVLYLVKGIGPTNPKPLKLTQKKIADLCASFQKAAVDVLVAKTIRAAQNLKPKTIILGGGVAANKLLRQELKRQVTRQLKTSKLILPEIKLTTDNALMIALAAWAEIKFLKPDASLKADANLRLDARH